MTADLIYVLGSIFNQKYCQLEDIYSKNINLSGNSTLLNSRITFNKPIQTIPNLEKEESPNKFYIAFKFILTIICIMLWVKFFYIPVSTLDVVKLKEVENYIILVILTWYVLPKKTLSRISLMIEKKMNEERIVNFNMKTDRDYLFEKIAIKYNLNYRKYSYGEEPDMSLPLESIAKPIFRTITGNLHSNKIEIVDCSGGTLGFFQDYETASPHITHIFINRKKIDFPWQFLTHFRNFSFLKEEEIEKVLTSLK